MSEKKILIIDDARDLAHAITVRLKSEGFRIEVAYDAIQGLAAAVSSPPDLIVLDLRLPGGSGYDILEKLKMMPRPATCPSWSLRPAARLEPLRRCIWAPPRT